MNKNLFVLVSSMALAACSGSGNSSGGGGATPHARMLNVPKNAQAISSNQFMSEYSTTFQAPLVAGMYAVNSSIISDHLTGTLLDAKVDTTCASKRTTTKIILKADSQFVYSTELQEEQGSNYPYYDSVSGKITCATEVLEKSSVLSVRKSKRGTFVDLQNLISTGQLNSLTFYQVSSAIVGVYEVKPAGKLNENMYGEYYTEMDVNQPVELGTTLEKSYYSYADDGYKYLDANAKLTRESTSTTAKTGFGSYYDLASLKESLKTAYYCDEMAPSNSSCVTKDLSELVP